MEILGVHHIGKIVDDIKAELAELKKIGFDTDDEIKIDDFQKVRVGLATSNDFSIELLEPLDESSPISKSKKGLNHLCLTVKSIDEALKEIKEKGLGFPLTEVTTSVFEGKKIVFIGTKSRDIYELIEE